MRRHVGTRRPPSYEGHYKLCYPGIEVSVTPTHNGVSVQISHRPGALDAIEVDGWKQHPGVWPALTMLVKRKPQ